MAVADGVVEVLRGLAKSCSHLALSRRLPDKATERVATVDSKANADRDHESERDCTVLHAHQRKQPPSASCSAGWRDVAPNLDLPHAQRLFYTRCSVAESLEPIRVLTGIKQQ